MDVCAFPGSAPLHSRSGRTKPDGCHMHTGWCILVVSLAAVRCRGARVARRCHASGSDAAVMGMLGRVWKTKIPPSKPKVVCTLASAHWLCHPPEKWYWQTLLPFCFMAVYRVGKVQRCWSGRSFIQDTAGTDGGSSRMPMAPPTL
ncbi:hypothetical protein K431DRAFT_281946 [Polychaeton citri CBS 116435]|uniref:Uncharacterized protein n=1 Tax=Polychaeton citri CBS 116435 TaxID=1314669 RepID=A0A9P4QE24_9PEZI|nr:hypothetical protein K431DRAFT_281946 [Polychaeton citri CBS 116435]